MSPVSNAAEQINQLAPAGQHTNRLIDSANPYLLLHAHNPVDWYPWGPEALAQAKRENKPIFLSVGYSTCYWCHVAEKTLYSNPEIAKSMNEWFVNVKVDREERPDIDSIYMLARQLLTGEGGWPNNVFLTPEGRPFYAGSYFPPADDEFGRPGFPSILKSIHKAWTDDPQRVTEQAARAYAALQRATATPGASAANAVNVAAWRSSVSERILAQIDARYGGLSGGNGTKFPEEPMLGLLLADYQASGHAASLKAVTQALDAIAFGGIHDHLGGGFHRYSTEPSWSIPHFEKMLYDNAQLLRLCAEGYALTRNPLYRALALETGDYLGRRMMDKDGGFYTAEDAEAGGEEGSSYLWTKQEIIAALGPRDAERFFAVYTLKPMPQQPTTQFVNSGDRGVLRIHQPLPDAMAKLSGEQWVRILDELAPLRAKLLAVRAQREQPVRDEKMVVALNGLTIEALAKSGRLLSKPEYIAWAKLAGEHLWRATFDTKTGSLKHQLFRGQARVAGFLDDYALLGVGFVALHDATGEPVWRERAAALADAMLKRLGRSDGGLATSPDANNLLVAPSDDGDRVMPSGTSAALALLQQLAPYQPRYAIAASSLLRHMGPQVEAEPMRWPSLIANARTETLPPASAGLDTARYVHPSARMTMTADHDELVVSLRIDAGYHANANPASFDYLIPTTLQVEGAAPGKIAYPKATRFKPAFAPDGLDVYEGTVQIVAAYPKGTLGRYLHGTVKAQACNRETCLPPAEIPWSASR